jgi:hypothetical protein
MRTVSKSVSETVSAGYPRIIQNSKGILWNSLRNQAKYHQKKANVGTNPTPSAYSAVYCTLAVPVTAAFPDLTGTAAIP